MTVVTTVAVGLQPFGRTRGGMPHGIWFGRAEGVHDASGGSVVIGLSNPVDNVLLLMRNYSYTNQSGANSQDMQFDMLAGVLQLSGQEEVQRSLVLFGSSVSLELLRNAGLFVWTEQAFGGVFVTASTGNTNGEQGTVYAQGYYWRMDELRKRGVGPALA